MNSKKLSNGNNSVSEQAQTVFRQIEEEKQRQGRFIKLQSGETRTFQFNPDKVELMEDEFEGICLFLLKMMSNINRRWCR